MLILIILLILIFGGFGSGWYAGPPTATGGPYYPYRTYGWGIGGILLLVLLVLLLTGGIRFR